jgi:hypothetical protein
MDCAQYAGQMKFTMDSSAIALMDFLAMRPANVSRITSQLVESTSIGIRRRMRASATQDTSESAASVSQLAIAKDFRTGMATNAYASQATSLIQLFKDVLSKIPIQFAQRSALSTECSAVAIRVTSQSKKKHVASAQLDSIGLDAHAHQIKFVMQTMFGTLRQTLVGQFWRNVESMKDGTVLSVSATTFMTE